MHNKMVAPRSFLAFVVKVKDNIISGLGMHSILAMISAKAKAISAAWSSVFDEDTDTIRIDH